MMLGSWEDNRRPRDGDEICVDSSMSNVASSDGATSLANSVSHKRLATLD